MKIHTFVVSVTLLGLGTAPAEAALIQVTAGDLLGDARVLDFETGTPGPIAGAHPLFTAFGLTNAALLNSAGFTDDVLNSGVFGNALGSQGGVLSVIAPGDDLDNAPLSFAFSVAGTATQFGFRVIDQINFSMTVEVWRSGALLDSVGYDPTGTFPNPIVYFESSQSFDEFRILSDAVPDPDASGWALDDLTLAGVAAVPEPSTFSLFGGALLGLVLVRRRRQATRS